ncbi:c-type cytochrome [Aeoliella mucimassa]|uniref:Cytochrome c n=1 Tax=Aeoliella mucimassa TaxID=2527972 RepID=A0A518AGX1_9BACT|nr:c-type cytochrome [Aeoliella mucimassa]QDU53949.1 Cytochrome c [Aeoliella mucimassa]
MTKPSKPWIVVFAAITLGAFASLAIDTEAQDKPATSQGDSTVSDSESPATGLKEVVELGRDIVMNTNTHPLTKEFVGNDLKCTSCHLEGGTDPKAGTFIGLATAYPAWSPREQRVITLEDRILNCFMRSMNGTRLPVGSKASVAMATYITSLSEGMPMKMNQSKPLGPNHVPMLEYDFAKANIERGMQLYADECAYCHGDQGEGTDDGPPVWGDRSYNNGAGLSRVPKMASWLKVAMPLGDPYLTEEQCADIAAYVNSKPRPEFKMKDHLPPAEKMGEYNGVVEE